MRESENCTLALLCDRFFLAIFNVFVVNQQYQNLVLVHDIQLI